MITLNAEVSDYNACDIEDAINSAFTNRGDHKVLVNGREVNPRFPGLKVASSYMNHTVRASVVGRSKSTTGDVYAKVGQRIVVELV